MRAKADHLWSGSSAVARCLSLLAIALSLSPRPLPRLAAPLPALKVGEAPRLQPASEAPTADGPVRSAVAIARQLFLARLAVPPAPSKSSCRISACSSP